MQYALLFYNPPLGNLPAPQRDDRGRRDAGRDAHLARGARARRCVPHDAAARPDGVGDVAATRTASEVLVTDGPFAETKEILGGLAILECADLDEALAFAKRCPLARIGTVEVRPEFGPPR